MKILRTTSLIICIFQLTLVHGQNISTYFLDSLKIIIDGDTLVNDGKTKVHFLNNTRDTGLIVFQKSNYSLRLDFQFVTSFYQLQEGWPDFYKDGKVLPLAQREDTNDVKICDMIAGKKILQNIT